MTGVYCWLNTVTGQRLVGSAARSLDRRRKEYLWRLARGDCHNQRFQRSWRKYGAESFVWEVLEYCEPSECADRETYWISFCRATEEEYGFNFCSFGRNNLGARLTQEHKDKIGRSNAKALAGRRATVEHCLALSAALTGRKKTAEHAARIAAVRTGARHTSASRLKMSIAKAGKPGRPHTEEEKRKIAESIRATLAKKKKKLMNQQTTG